MKIHSAFLLLLAFMLDTSSAERVPTTKIALTPPEGFAASKTFAGFENAAKGSAITIMEINEGLDVVLPQFSDEALAAEGSTVILREQIKIGPDPGILLKMGEAGDAEDQSWAVLFGDATNSVLVVVALPGKHEAELAGPLKKSLLDITWTKDAVVPPLENLPYRVTEVADLKVANVAGSTVTLTRGGVMPQKDGKAPLVIVMASGPGNPIPPADRLANAKELLNRTGIVRDARIIAKTTRTIGGLEAVVIDASGLHKSEELPVRVKFALLCADDEFFAICARIATEDKDKYLPEFDKLIGSFTLVEP